MRLLYLGRLHPIKGIDNLLRALNEVDDVKLSLEIYGDGEEAYKLHLRQLIHELGLERRVGFMGHVDGEEKTKAFMESDVCIVPSFTENFGMVVAESLVHGVPVIAGKGTPWPDLDARGCGLWVENTPKSLAEAIRRICNADLSEMGVRARGWMKEAYSSDAQAVRMHALYKKLTD